jgi:hypothetical protein
LVVYWFDTWVDLFISWILSRTLVVFPAFQIIVGSCSRSKLARYIILDLYHGIFWYGLCNCLAMGSLLIWGWVLYGLWKC